MKAYDPAANAATGSAGQAAAMLAGSVISLLAAMVIEINFGEVLLVPFELFLVWLGAVLFTLGILEYRRSQEPPTADHGPEV